MLAKEFLTSFLDGHEKIANRTATVVSNAASLNDAKLSVGAMVRARSLVDGARHRAGRSSVLPKRTTLPEARR